MQVFASPNKLLPEETYATNFRIYSQGAKCTRAESCFSIRTGDALYLQVADQRQWSSDEPRVPELRLRFVSDNLDAQALDDSTSDWIKANTTAATVQGFHQFKVVASTFAAMMVVEIRINGEQIQASPVFVQVLFPECADIHQVQTAKGCVCQEGFTEFAGLCRDSMMLAGQVTAAVLAVVLLLLVGTKLYFQYASDRSWRIRPDDLKFSSPPEWIGRGRNTVVYRGEYRNMEIAAKTLQSSQKDSIRQRTKASQSTMHSGMSSQPIASEKTTCIKLGKGPGIFAGGRWQQAKQQEAAWNVMPEHGKGGSYFSTIDHRYRMRRLV